MSEVIETKIVGRITVEELTHLNIRNQIIKNKEAECELLKNEKQFFLANLQTKYKLDPAKKYSIDNEGRIVETAEVAKETSGG